MKSSARLAVIDKITEYEKNGLWNKDVEDDPENIVLTPDKVDYLNEKITSRIMSFIANKVAVRYYEGLIKKGELVIKQINGLDNFRKVQGGAIITCNHFSVCDNYAVFRAIRNELPKGKNLYKVIKEGNYTNFKGLFGFFFRHCNTLPLSSNTATLKKFFVAVKTLLGRGEKILVYPEQSMWWNYRKPRPLKDGAFKFAAKSSVPVIPVFITMEDTEKLDADGFPIQAYIIHFLPAIYPDSNKSEKENVAEMKEKNYNAWKKVYESVYGTELKYETQAPLYENVR